MAAFNKFQVFTKDLVNGVHNFTSNTIKIFLSNDAPSASGDAVKADITEISAGNGYTAGGNATTITVSTASGVAKVTGTDPTAWTASGGSIGPFQYAVLWNDTPTSPADPLIGWWDYGSAVTLSAGESFTVDLDGTNGIFTVT